MTHISQIKKDNVLNQHKECIACKDLINELLKKGYEYDLARCGFNISDCKKEVNGKLVETKPPMAYPFFISDEMLFKKHQKHLDVLKNKKITCV